MGTAISGQHAHWHSARHLFRGSPVFAFSTTSRRHSGFMAVSTPSFFLGLGLMYLFAVELKWLPTSGMRTLGQPESVQDLAGT